MHPDDELRQVELACEIGQRWWNQGLMTEATKRVIEFFFQEVGMNRIFAVEILLRARSKSMRLPAHVYAYEKSDRYSWAVQLKETGEVIGRYFGMHPDDERKKAAMPRNASAKPVVKPGIQVPFGLPLTTPGNTCRCGDQSLISGKCGGYYWAVYSRLWQFSLFVS